jgi:hypothetical protein
MQYRKTYSIRGSSYIVRSNNYTGSEANSKDHLTVQQKSSRFFMQGMNIIFFSGTPFWMQRVNLRIARSGTHSIREGHQKQEI